MSTNDILLEVSKLTSYIELLDKLISLIKTIPNQRDTKVTTWLDDIHKTRTQFIGDIIRLRLDQIDMERAQNE